MKPYVHKFLQESITVSPMGEIAGFPVRPGMFDINGAVALPVGVNFTIHSRSATSVSLLLYHRGEETPYAVLPFPKEYKIGDVYSMIVFDLNIADFEYAYQIDGPWEPKKGLLFDAKQPVLDPYARAVAGQRVWGVPKKGIYRARVIDDNFEWGDMPQSKQQMTDLVIYELHVRGFTQHPTSGVQHPGTFAGLREKIPYLKELGINAVELMPIFEFDETLNSREINGKQLLECWGYNTVGFFAPNSSYASTPEYNHEGTELKELIRALHDNGIEVILDVVFNHTAEGNEKGPSFSFKGLDNDIYYMLTPDGDYYNFSGCGNTLNCNHPVVRQMISECLRYWTIYYRVDGFRFDLASILGRNEDGAPLSKPPLLQALAYDPILSNVKLIAEAWDAGGMYQVGKFPASRRWAEWNGRYRDTLRSYLKGDFWQAWSAAWSISGSGDLYGAEGILSNGKYGPFFNNEQTGYAGYNSCINFLTCHDGFTLYDLYAYNDKHNESNGWDNTDGANDNRSWNCGAEGPTDDPEVLSLRFRMIRNACAVLMCSWGAPIFFAGDEFGNTQYGNNNSYCQDNEIFWLDWSLIDKNRPLFEFFKFMIAFRHRHTVVRRNLPNPVCGMDLIHTHAANADLTDIPRDAHTFGICFAGYDSTHGQDDIVYIAINAYWEPVDITLPRLKREGAWFMTVDTWGDENGRYCWPEGQEVHIGGSYRMRPRTIAIFVGKEH